MTQVKDGKSAVVRTVKCEFCQEDIELADSNECEICNAIVCDLCAEEKLHQVRMAPDDFTNVCIECLEDKYDNQ